MNGYGNRGMTFESLIGYANSRYKADGTAIIEKQHTLCTPLRNGTGHIVSAKYEEKATVDFMGRYGARPLAFEAKHCSEDVIALSRVEPHQYDFLHDWTYGGDGIGFILVSFRFTDFYLIPYYGWVAAKAAHEQKSRGDKPKVPTVDGFTPTGKASIRRDELPEKWLIPSGGTAALDYLAVAEKIWGGTT
ncbi:MAG: Holliday junction resolvase RecU [Clostridium sp.]|jgi:recombination protein U|nr:Holliday junction resolvase RecU [Clostridium sp.]